MVKKEKEPQRSTYRERQEAERLAQKRANVGKIGGGSQQLLAGMSGNAWDSILKARPRQSPVMPLRGPLFSIREAQTQAKALPGDHREKQRDRYRLADRCSKFVRSMGGFGLGEFAGCAKVRLGMTLCQEERSGIV